MKLADLNPREQAAVRAYYAALSSFDFDSYANDMPVGTIRDIRAVIASADETRADVCAETREWLSQRLVYWEHSESPSARAMRDIARALKTTPPEEPTP